jgi:hypothetical protein
MRCQALREHKVKSIAKGQTLQEHQIKSIAKGQALEDRKPRSSPATSTGKTTPSSILWSPTKGSKAQTGNKL